jgi:sodium-dependent dicarboxylate transporter 2/3/5
MTNRKWRMGAVSMVAQVPFYFLTIDGSHQAAMCMGLTVTMVILWVTEVIPTHITALLPLVELPLMGIASGTTLPAVFFKDSIVLFVVAAMLGVSIVKTDLHHRFALNILAMCISSHEEGVRPERLYFGFFLALWFLSMWMSNTATVTLMAPLALSALDQLDDTNSGEGFDGGSEELTEANGGARALSTDRLSRERFKCGLVTGLAYSANVGGIGTLIGTSTNLVFADLFSTLFPAGPSVSFGRWP